MVIISPGQNPNGYSPPIGFHCFEVQGWVQIYCAYVTIDRSIARKFPDKNEYINNFLQKRNIMGHFFNKNAKSKLMN